MNSRYKMPRLELIKFNLCDMGDCKQPQKYVVFTCHGSFDGTYCEEHGIQQFVSWNECKLRYDLTDLADTPTLQIEDI